MVTEMGDEGSVPTVSMSEHAGDGVAWLRASAALASPRRESPRRESALIMAAAGTGPGFEALERIVSIPKLDPSMLTPRETRLHNTDRARLKLLRVTRARVRMKRMM